MIVWSDPEDRPVLICLWIEDWKWRGYQWSYGYFQDELRAIITVYPVIE